MHGFTLIELVIVVLILGILAGLAQPMLTQSVTDARLRAATSEVATALEYARATAINTGRVCRVEFDVDAETVEVSQAEHELIGDLLDPGKPELSDSDIDDFQKWSYVTMDNPVHPGSPYIIDFADKPVFGGVDIVAVAFAGGGAALDFNALGVASDDFKMAIGFGGRTGGISVDAASGKIDTIF